MTASGNAAKGNGWHWTRRGWVRNKPRPKTTAKAPPPKRQFRRQIVVTRAPEREKAAFQWRAPQMAQERLSILSAPPPPPEPEKRAQRQPRAAWHGKYAALEIAARRAVIGEELDREAHTRCASPSP